MGGGGIRLQKYEVRVNNYHINTVFPSRLRLLLLLLGWGGGVCVCGGSIVFQRQQDRDHNYYVNTVFPNRLRLFLLLLLW